MKKIILLTISIFNVMTIAFLACTKERLITNGENPKEFANLKKQVLII